MSNTVRTKWLMFMIIACVLLISGCASSFNPRPADEVGFMGRAQTHNEGDVRVTAAVLSAEECSSKFGSNLYRQEYSACLVGNRKYGC